VRMGYSFAKPTIAKLATGGWAVVFGNGYESTNHTNGKAALFVVDAINGNLLKSLEVAGTNGTANGLSTPKLSDYNDDGVAEFAYAGDLQGNLWRFNLYDNSADNFDVAYNGSPLFRAVAADDPDKAQPITSAPSLVRHATGRGYMVIFGTGKYFEVGDNLAGSFAQVQSFYGIWDDNAPVSDRSLLQNQPILGTATANGMPARRLGNSPINWNSQKGWVIDLKLSSGSGQGERAIGRPSVQLGSVLFTTYSPIGDICNPGGDSRLYVVSAQTGAPDLNIAGCPGCAGITISQGNPVLTAVTALEGRTEGRRAGIDDPLPPGGPASVTEPAAVPECTNVIGVIVGNQGFVPFRQIPCGRVAWRQLQ